jgi:hypothetical protein
MKGGQIAAGVVLAAGAAYSLYSGNTALAVFFAALFTVAMLAPRLISRTSEVSFGDFRASFKKSIDNLPALSDEERRDLKKRIDAAASVDEAVAVIASIAGGRAHREE